MGVSSQLRPIIQYCILKSHYKNNCEIISEPFRREAVILTLSINYCFVLRTSIMNFHAQAAVRSKRCFRGLGPSPHPPLSASFLCCPHRRAYLRLLTPPYSRFERRTTSVCPKQKAFPFVTLPIAPTPPRRSCTVLG